MLTHTSLDDEEDSGNFDLMLEFRPEDFKDFSEIARQLTDFRNQNKALTVRWREVSARVKSYENELAKMDEIMRYFPADEEWKSRVLGIKAEYVKRVNYAKEKDELETLKTQLDITQKISKEFKISMSRDFTCMICYENDVKLFLDACGHMCCNACWDAIAARPVRPDVKLCPYCRTETKSKKIYFG